MLYISFNNAIKILFTYFLITSVTKIVKARNLNEMVLLCQNFFTKFNSHLMNLTHFFRFIIKYKIIEYFVFDNDNKDKLIIDKQEEYKKPEIRYEDRYLEDIRKMPNLYEFTEQEKSLENTKFTEFLLKNMNETEKKIQEIIEKINQNEFKLSSLEDDKQEYIIVKDDTSVDETKEEKIKKILDDNYILNEQLLRLKNDKYKNEEVTKAKSMAYEYIVNERLDKLKNNFIIEKTPLGNVLMFYNNKRESFEYYSDCTIPYRYLEPVGRKYVKTFNCRPIFVDMEEELKEYERKIAIQLKKQEEDKKLEEEKRLEISKKNGEELKQKKDVFTKFKSYNKDANGRVVTAAPPKNSIPSNNPLTENKKNEPIILKERTNRYTHEGKFSNFNILKKVDRKAVDKKYAMTFADFKKMQQEMKNKKLTII